MIWLMWRQHRTDILVMGCILIVLTFMLVLTGRGIHDSYQQLAISACLHLNPSAACQVSIAPLGYVTFAVALAFAAGALLRRTIAAMVAALLLYLLTRVSLTTLRYSWLPTQTIIWDPLKQSNPNIYHGDWTVQDGWVDMKGHTVSTLLVNNTCFGNPQCTHQQGWLQYMVVQLGTFSTGCGQL